MKKLPLFLSAFLLVSVHTYSQGCIPLRNINGVAQYNLADNSFLTSDWQLSINTRYFRSFRDYKEKVDQKTPIANETVNEVYTEETSVTKLLKHGWSLDLSIPITANARTSSFEHGGPNTQRRTTRSFGLGDMRFTAYKWILQPAVNQKWNIQVGLGIKFPTGDYKYQDYFYRNDTTRVLSAVNPGIQLGDGGTGIITAANTFYVISKTISLFGEFYYVVNPRDENGTLFTTGRTPTTLQIQSDGINNSVPDVYAIHAGAYINVKKVSFSAAIRDEGIPVYDLIGGSDGLRRAGHYFSAEPGVLYRMKKITAYAYLPIIMDRRIKQNVADKKASEISGVYTVGGGGSANYELLVGVNFRF